MLRTVYAMLLMSVVSLLYMECDARNAVVVDSLSHIPLPSASVLDRNGKMVGKSDAHGRLPSVPSERYPLTVCYLGFFDGIVTAEDTDTVFLRENIAELPEVVVESRRHKVLHMLAFVREYSSLTTYTDTVFLFREKMVDYMLTPDRKVKFSGWSTPRVLTGRSYYRFTNDCGLDSVSDTGSNHFSWSDWIGVAPTISIPSALTGREWGADTLRGRYSPVEIWSKRSDSLSVEVNVLADKAARRWVPTVATFFRDDLEFENFRLRYDYFDAGSDSLSALELNCYSYDIESNGRGHRMFRFNRVDEPVFVSTHAEVYFLEKEYITVKEAKKWLDYKFNTDIIGIYESVDAPALPPSVVALIERVENIDKGGVRLEQTPDERLMSFADNRRNFRIGRRALFLLKQVTGITLYKSRRNFNRRWNDVKSDLRNSHKNTETQ